MPFWKRSSPLFQRTEPVERLRERAFNLMAPNNSKLLFKPIDEEMSESLIRLSNKNDTLADPGRPRLPPGMTWANAIPNGKNRKNSIASDPGYHRSNSFASDPGYHRSNSFASNHRSASFASDPGLPGPHPPPGPKPQAVYNRRKTAKGGMQKRKTRRYRF
jgi:hypothetical protein